MFEPITILTGFLTMWAQLNNYGIDVEKSPHLKNVRVKRDIPDYIHPVLKDSLIIKNIARFKRQAYNANNNMQNDYVETIIPLANYPPNSKYASQNTAGVPYYYNAYNGNNKVFYGNGVNDNNNGYNGNNNAYNGNNNGYNGNGFGQRDTANGQIYRGNEKSGKLVTYPNGINLNQGTIATSIYNPFPSNTNVATNNNIANNNGNNNGLNNGNNSSDGKKNDTLLPASFMGSSTCPGYLKSVKIFGTQVCMSDDY